MHRKEISKIHALLNRAFTRCCLICSLTDQDHIMRHITTIHDYAIGALPKEYYHCTLHACNRTCSILEKNDIDTSAIRKQIANLPTA